MVVLGDQSTVSDNFECLYMSYIDGKTEKHVCVKIGALYLSTSTLSMKTSTLFLHYCRWRAPASKCGSHAQTQNTTLGTSHCWPWASRCSIHNIGVFFNDLSKSIQKVPFFVTRRCGPVDRPATLPGPAVTLQHLRKVTAGHWGCQNRPTHSTSR